MKNKKYYNVELNRKDTMLLIDYLYKNNIHFENSYIDSNYCHTEILLNNEEVSMVNDFLDII